jgi:hypothetical protein
MLSRPAAVTNCITSPPMMVIFFQKWEDWLARCASGTVQYACELKEATITKTINTLPSGRAGSEHSPGLPTCTTRIVVTLNPSALLNFFLFSGLGSITLSWLDRHSPFSFNARFRCFSGRHTRGFWHRSRWRDCGPIRYRCDRRGR